MEDKNVRLMVILNNYCLTAFMGLFETLCYSHVLSEGQCWRRL